MTANFSVEEVIEKVTTDNDVDENEEFEESDTYEVVMRQKLDELVEYAVKRQADFNQDTFKHLRFDMAWLTLTNVQPLMATL